MFGLNLNNYDYQKMQNMYTAGFGGQQTFSPNSNADNGVFSVNGNNNVGGSQAVSFGALTGGNAVTGSQNGNSGLVERLDRMDAMYQKPVHQDAFRANKLDLFA